jgi:hypothetical protein
MGYDRDRVDRSDRDPSARSQGSGGTTMTLGKVVTSAGAVGKFLRWNPVTLSGTMTEGAAPTLTVHTGITLLGELVQGAAAAGDILLFRAVNYRWVTEGKGGTTTVGPCNPATTLLTLNVKSCYATNVSGANVLVEIDEEQVGSGTTDASGNFRYNADRSGTYNFRWSYSDARGSLSGLAAFVISGGCNPLSLDDTFISELGPGPTGYCCCGNTTPTTPLCKWPHPRQLYMTTSRGTDPMTINPFDCGYWGSVGANYVDGGVTRGLSFRLDCNGTVQMFWGAGSVDCTAGMGDPAQFIVPPYRESYVLGVFDICHHPFQNLTGIMPTTSPCGWKAPCDGEWTISL